MAIFGSAPTGKTGCALQLDGRFRAALYTVFSVLLVTGVAWLPADRLKSGAGDDLWSALAPVLLLGALVPLHLAPAWRRDKNRAMGVAMATLTALLIATAFGLYYLGSDTLRGWASDLHIALGLAFPTLLAAHVMTGRRRCSQQPGVPQRPCETAEVATKSR